MEIVKFIYQNQEIDFLPAGNENVMVNATQMAKIFGKRIDFFLKTDHAKSFIEILKLTPYGGSFEKLTDEEIIKSRSGSRTFFHKLLALKFAAWLDPKFELWVYATIDKIILGHFKDLKEAVDNKLQKELLLKQKKAEYLLKYPDIIEIFEIENDITAAGKQKVKAMRESMNQLKFDFNTAYSN